MASRTLTVALRALVQGYTGPMRAAAAATGPLEASLMRVQRAGAGLTRVGSTLTSRLTLPLVAVGAVATKMAADFDKSFTTMQTLAGVTGDEVAGLKDAVLDLAGETGRAPQELAEALYFLQSSGLDSAQAMDALEVSAKASAAGLGETQVIADAVSSAMLGYAQSGLTAAEATDVLVATAREGKAEPAELAAQMGRLIPVASELGISFDQVGGAIAALSTKGFNAEQATTALTNVMAKLLKPSMQAQKALDAVGLSTDGIRQMLAEKGLLGTLEELRARLGNNGFVKFLEDQQAVQGGLALLGGDLEATKGIMAAVADSAGATENAFGTWAESMGAQNAQAFAEFQVALIRIGEVIAPIASDVLDFASTIIEAFSKLPDGAQTAILGFALVVAAIGPLLSVGGKLLTLFTTTAGALKSFAVPAGTFAGSIGTVERTATGAAGGVSRLGTAAKIAAGAAGLAGLVLAAKQLGDQADRLNIDNLVEALNSTSDGARASTDEVIKASVAFDRLDTTFSKVLDTSVPAAEQFIAQAEALGVEKEALDGLRQALEEKKAADVGGTAASSEYSAEVGAAADALDEQTGATEEATSALQEYSDALKAQFDPLFGMVDALDSQRQAMQDVRDRESELQKLRESGTATEAELAAAEQALSDARVTAAKSVVDLQVASNTLKEAMETEGLTAEAARAQFIDLALAQNFTKGEAEAMADMFGFATTKAEELGRSDPHVSVTQTGAVPVRGLMERVDTAIRRIPGNKRVVITADGSSAIATANGVVRYINGLTGQVTIVSHSVPLHQTFGGGQAAGGPVSADKWYVVGENGPEVFAPGMDGQIIPNHALAADMTPALVSAGGMAMGGGGGAVDVRMHITGHGAMAEQFRRSLRTGEIQLTADGKRVEVRR